MINDLANALLLFYLVYQGVVGLLVLRAISGYKGYFHRGIWVSDLGMTNHKSSGYFNTALKIYGLLSLSIPLKAALVLQPNPFTQLMIWSLVVISVAMVLIGFFTENESLFFHLFFAAFSQVGMIVFSVLAIILNYQSAIFPWPLIIINILIPPVIITADLGYFMFLLNPKRKQQGKFVVFSGKLEWFLLLLCTLWNTGFVFFLFGIWK